MDHPRRCGALTDEPPEDDRTDTEADGAAAPQPDEGPPRPPLPPAEEGTRTVPVDVEARFPEIARLKASGSAMFVVAALTAVAPLFLQGSAPLEGGRTLLAPALASAGAAVGIAGLLAPAARRTALLLAPMVLVAAAAAAARGASLDTIPPLELALGFAFAASWLLAMEHLHALGRFVELGAYITRQRLTTFSLGGVVNHFQVYGAGLVAIIAVVAAVVVVGVPWVFAAGSTGTFARSVELNSVFGVALAAAVVFTLSALILVFVRSVMPQRLDVERVAYSRDRMEDMLRSSQLVDSTDDEGR